MIRTAKIRGRKWKIRRVPRRVLEADRVGDCDHPSNPKRMIRLADDLRGRLLLTTLIHKMLHACYWDLDEDAVTEAACDMGRLLWRMGYRIDKR